LDVPLVKVQVAKEQLFRMKTSENLLIIFVKNILLGKVKTRLAKSIGDTGAFEVYRKLVEITEKETSQLENCDIHIYFSDQIIDSKWTGKEKFVQDGSDLGERMKNAFTNAFNQGYHRVVGVGSDLPDLKAAVITKGFDALKKKDTVFGPATDGGYYLLGMYKMIDCIFENKDWSTDYLLKQTLVDLDSNQLSYSLLDILNDIDNLEDLKKSSISTNFKHLYELS
jgi:uncharacterized protein